MKVKIPSIDLMFNGHIDQIEKNYMNEYFNSGEKDLKYLQVWSQYKRTLETLDNDFSDNIIVLTIPFIDMVKKYWDSIKKIYIEEIKNQDSGIIQFRGIVFDQNNGCILEMTNQNIVFSIFTKETGVPVIIGEISYDSNTSETKYSYSVFLSLHENIIKDIMIPYVYRFVFSIIFEKLIDGKNIIVVPPNGRGKTINDKYINENKKSIKVWDSRKFNSYVRLDGFTVTGHLRHQRTGKDRKEHKLIWIEEFRKHGYNRNKLKMNLSG